MTPSLTREQMGLGVRVAPEPTRHRRRRRRWPRGPELGRRALLAAPLLAIGFAIWAFGGVYGWAYGISYLLIFGALAVWSYLCLRGGMVPRWRPIYLPLVLFALVVATQLFGGRSEMPGSTLTAALHLGAAGALFLVVSQCYVGARDARWISTSFAVFTAALALLAIAQSLTASVGIYWHFTYAYASPAGSFVNRNHFSGCMEMLLPVACLESYYRRAQPWLRWLPWVASPALGIGAVVMAASRGGLASLTAEALAGLLIALYLARPQSSSAPVSIANSPNWWPPPLSQASKEIQPRPTGFARRRGIGLAAAVALTGALVAVLGTGRIEARIEQTSLHSPSLAERANLNQSSLAMFGERPVWGWGLGTWADVYPEFARFTSTSVFAFAHNDYLQMLAETGLLGAGCAFLFWWQWSWGFFSLLRQAARGGLPPNDSAGLALAVAAAVACLGILVHSWVDFNLHIPANLLLFFALAGLALPNPWSIRNN